MSLAKRTAKFNNLTKLDIRARHAVLRKLEGWFSVQGIPEDPEALDWLVQYHASGSPMTFTKWLSRVKKIDNVRLSVLGQQLVALNVKLSCQHKDFLRLGMTNHYRSCMLDLQGHGRQQLQYLADPDVAVLFVPDRAGNYQWRSLLRLVYAPFDLAKSNCYALVYYRVYGNGPSSAIFQALAQQHHLPVYAAVPTQGLPNKPCVKLLSPTRHNNPFMQKPVWTDHRQSFTTAGQIQIEALALPVAVPKS